MNWCNNMSVSVCVGGGGWQKDHDEVRGHVFRKG